VRHRSTVYDGAGPKANLITDSKGQFVRHKPPPAAQRLRRSLRTHTVS
jgi:hypothetical protein